MLLKMNHVYAQVMKEFSDDIVDAVHEVPNDAGQHWAEESGKCWCHPALTFDEMPGLSYKVKIYSHKKYKPNWGS